MVRRILGRLSVGIVMGLALVGGFSDSAQAQDGQTSATVQPDWPEPTEVVIALDVHNIWIDERETRYDLDAFLTAAWLDPRLAFDCGPDEVAYNDRIYQGAAARDLLKTEIWWPDFTIQDGIGPRETTALGVAIECDGFVFYEERFVASVHQTFDLNEFPFDTQQISITISPFFQLTDRVEFVGIEEYFGIHESEAIASLPESEFRWDTTEWSIDDRGFISPLVKNDDYASATFSATLERSSSYYVWNVIMPLVLIASMSWAVFWMDLGRMTLADRIGVSLTSLLTVVAFDFLTDDNLPKLPYSTRLDNLYVVSYVLVGLTVVASVVGEVRLERADDDGVARVIRVDRLARLVFPIAYAIAIIYALFGPVTPLSID